MASAPAKWIPQLTGKPGDHYKLCAPFIYKPAARKLQESALIDPADRDGKIASLKAYHQQEWIDVPNDEWDQGHRSPDDTNPSVLQPRSYQRSRRDRFKFDEHGLVVCPTAEEVASNPGKYYSEDEMAKLAKAYEAMRTDE